MHTNTSNLACKTVLNFFWPAYDLGCPPLSYTPLYKKWKAFRSIVFTSGRSISELSEEILAKRKMKLEMKIKWHSC